MIGLILQIKKGGLREVTAFIHQGWGIAQLQGAPFTLSSVEMVPFGAVQFTRWPCPRQQSKGWQSWDFSSEA